MTSPRDTARGDRIKYVRKELLGFASQEAFAQWIGNVTRGAVGNWERGLDIGLDNMIAIAKKADLSLEWLAHNKGPRPQKGQLPGVALTSKDHFESAVASFEKLSSDERKRFLKRVLEL